MEGAFNVLLRVNVLGARVRTYNYQRAHLANAFLG